MADAQFGEYRIVEEDAESRFNYEVRWYPDYNDPTNYKRVEWVGTIWGGKRAIKKHKKKRKERLEGKVVYSELSELSEREIRERVYESSARKSRS